jgi:metallo-beta-lactamase family protein
VHDSIALNGRPEPCVIIAASGMCEAGRILHHLKHNIEEPRNTILIVGYQAPNTLGERLVQRRPEVRILGRSLTVKAEVIVLNGLSSHADHGELMQCLSPLVSQVRQVRLVHGVPERAEALAVGLRAAGFADVGIPDRGDQATLA